MSIRRCVYLHCVCLGMFICFDFTKYGSSSGVLNIFCLHKFTVCSTTFLELGHVTFLATYANAVIRDSSSPNFHPRVSSRKSTGRSGHPLLAKPSCACHPAQMLRARLKWSEEFPSKWCACLTHIQEVGNRECVTAQCGQMLSLKAMVLRSFSGPWCI